MKTSFLVSHLKASCTNTKQKVNLIISNRYKYSISAMCRLLKVTRSLIYYHINMTENNMVSDLTYVRVGNKWNYICLIVDLHNREIGGYSAGKNKDSKLVEQDLRNCNVPLNRIKLFHSDRGREFDNKNKLIICIITEVKMKEYEKPVFKSVNSNPNVTPKAVAVLVYLAVAYKTKMGVNK